MRMPLLSLGGKFEYARMTTDDGAETVQMAWDDQKSFRDGALAAAAGVATYAAMLEARATEETARVAAVEGTKREMAGQAAQLQGLKEANRHTEAMMEIPAAAAVVVP